MKNSSATAAAPANETIPAYGFAYLIMNSKTRQSENAIYRGKEKHGHIVEVAGNDYWARRTSGEKETPAFEFNPDIDRIH